MTFQVSDLELPPGPKAEGLVEAIAAAIGRGALKPGGRLPTQRELAARLGIGIGTVTRAYALARQRGLIHGVVGRGTFVSAAAEEDWRFLPERRPPADTDLSVNLPVRCPQDDEAAFVRTMESILAEQDGRRLLTIPWRDVEDRHREVGAAWCARSGWEVEPRRVLVGGSFHSCLLATLRLITRPGDLVLAEELTYSGLKAIGRACGVRVQGLEVDEQGLVPEALERACRDSPARVLYCRPTHHLVTTATLSRERRERIAAIAVERGLTVIEDDEDFALAEEPLLPIAAWAPENTVLIAGLNRALALGLHSSYVAAPAAIARELEDAIVEILWMTAPLLAEIAARWIGSDTADRLIAAKRLELAARQELAAQAFAGRELHAPSSCHHLWLPLPEPWDPITFVAAALQRGVALAPTGAFYVGRGAPPRAVRVCLGAPTDREVLATGLGQLAEVLDRGPQRTRIAM